MDYIVRRMREEDIPQVVEIEKIAFSRPWSKSIFKATLLLPYAAYYVAVEDAEGEISNVAVHPDFRGKGISRKMLDILMREAREDGVQAFTLEVRAGNEIAIGLYESLGFRTEGVRRGYYDHPKEDGLIMWQRP